jgi:hypothetical protein
MALFDMPELEQQRLKKARKYLRLFTMDTPELNRLVQGYEIDEDRLEFAIMLTISDWNSTTPLIGKVTLGNFPSLYLLIHGAAIQCLKMAGMYQSRNELTYSSGGSSFVRANKTPYYQSWIQNFASEYEAKKLNMKIQQNIEKSYGKGFGSEYELIGWDF